MSGSRVQSSLHTKPDSTKVVRHAISAKSDSDGAILESPIRAMVEAVAIVVAIALAVIIGTATDITGLQL